MLHDYYATAAQMGFIRALCKRGGIKPPSAPLLKYSTAEKRISELKSKMGWPEPPPHQPRTARLSFVNGPTKHRCEGCGFTGPRDSFLSDENEEDPVWLCPQCGDDTWKRTIIEGVMSDEDE